MRNLIFILFCICVMSCYAGKERKNDLNEGKTTKFRMADSFLRAENPTEVMLLGTWHFSYPNQDSYKTAKDDQVNFASEKRQKEILEVVKHLEHFKPTIICVETTNQRRIDSLYTLYLNDNYELKLGEDEQLGFRLGKKLGLNKLHAVDTDSWLWDKIKELPELGNLWDDEYYLDTSKVNLWYKKFDEYFIHEDKIRKEETLNDALFYMNHPDNLKANLYPYMVDMKTINDNGPDAFSLKWYDRNVRIYNNILKTNPRDEDRILVIYGASHITILEQLFEVSPHYKLIRPYKY